MLVKKSPDIYHRQFSLRPGLRQLVFVATGIAACVIAIHGGLADAAVTATGSFNPDPLEENTSVAIGIGTYGTLRIDEGSTFSTYVLELGVNPSGFGRATVTEESVLSANNVWVGSQGFGRLEVVAGGVVQSQSFGDFRIGGHSSNGHGEVIVSGDNSLLNWGGSFSVGGNQTTGLLRISDNATVNLSAQPQVAAGGHIDLDHGTLRVRDLQSWGKISGTGDIYLSDGFFSNSGRIESLEGDLLNIIASPSASGFGNSGEIIVDGGSLEIQPGFVNDSFGIGGGVITLRGAEFRVGLIGTFNNWQLLNRGSIFTTGEESHLYGTIRNEPDGLISITNQSRAVFHNLVENQFNGTIAVSPGSEALFLQGLAMNGGVLLADMVGVEGFGHVEVVGQAQLFGSLQINLAGEYTPKEGDLLCRKPIPAS